MMSTLDKAWKKVRHSMDFQIIIIKVSPIFSIYFKSEWFFRCQFLAGVSHHLLSTLTEIPTNDHL